MVAFFVLFAFFEGGALFLEPSECWAILGLHAEGGFGEEFAAAGSDFVDGAGVVDEEGAGRVHGVLFVFCFV